MAFSPGEYRAACDRLDELESLVRNRTADHEAGRFSNGQFKSLLDRVEPEARRLTEQIGAHREVMRKYGGAADAFTDGYDGFAGSAAGVKSFGSLPSPAHLTDTQLKGLWQASQNKTAFQVQIGAKGGLEQAFAAGVQIKSPVAESGLNQQLPAIMMPQRAVGLPYEPTRVAAFLTAAPMEGPSAAWLQHAGNAAEASGVAELGGKPDLGPIIKEWVAYPQKIAGRVSVSLEAGMDYPDFAAWLPTELERSVVNQESLYLLQAGYAGGPTGAVFNGLLATSGTLTRAVGTDTGLDALNKAINDLRVGAAFCEADLVVLHPTTWNALRREKDSMGRYLLQPDIATGNVSRVWDIPVCQSTQMPAGTGVVMSVKAGGGVFWTRLGMLLQYNPWPPDGWQENWSEWRCEERISLTVPRPAAVNIVTGLPS